MTETFLSEEDDAARCTICGAMKSRHGHPQYWKYWKGDCSHDIAGNQKQHQWIRD